MAVRHIRRHRAPTTGVIITIIIIIITRGKRIVYSIIQRPRPSSDVSFRPRTPPTVGSSSQRTYCCSHRTTLWSRDAVSACRLRPRVGPRKTESRRRSFASVCRNRIAHARHAIYVFRRFLPVLQRIRRLSRGSSRVATSRVDVAGRVRRTLLRGSIGRITYVGRRPLIDNGRTNTRRAGIHDDRCFRRHRVLSRARDRNFLFVFFLTISAFRSRFSLDVQTHAHTYCALVCRERFTPRCYDALSTNA